MGYIEYKVGGSGPLSYVAFTANSEQVPQVVPGSVAVKSPGVCGELEVLDPAPFMARIEARGLSATARTIVAIYEDGVKVAGGEACGYEMAVATWGVRSL